MERSRLLKDYEMMCYIQTMTTFRIGDILSTLSSKEYTNEEKIEKSILLAKDYWKESVEIIEEFQNMDI